MRLFVYCNLFLLFLIRRTCGSKLQLEKLRNNNDRNVLECLDTLISVTDWVVDDFLLISNDVNIVDDDLIRRYSNFGWKLYFTGNHNLSGFSNVIIFANNFDNLNVLLSRINVGQMDSRAKFVIIVAKNFESLNEIEESSKGIPEAMWKFDKTRVLYLVRCKEDIFAMTYFPFAINCQVGELEVLDVWRGKNFAKGAELFPEKMMDIRGCVQNHSIILNKLTTFQLHKEFTATGEMILGGIAGRLIAIVAERMNMKLHVSSEQTQSWDTLIDKILRDESLFSLAGNMPTPERLKILDMESTFMQESFAMGYIVRSFEVSWKNFLCPISSEAWGYIGCTFLLFGGSIFLMNRCHRRQIIPDKLTILDSFGIFLGTSQVLPRGYFARYLLGMWIVYSYLINAFYNSGLISFLTTPQEQRIIDTYEDLLADGIDFGGNAFHRHFYNNPSDPVMMEIYHNFKIWTDEERNRLLLSGQGATGVLTSTVYLHNSDHVDDVSCQIHMLKEKAFTFQAPIFMRRGSPFAIGVHRYVLQIIESGLIEYWQKYYTRTASSAGIGTDTPSKISIRHLRGVLYLYIAGMICSFIVFISEIIFHKYFSNRGFQISD